MRHSPVGLFILLVVLIVNAVIVVSVAARWFGRLKVRFDLAAGTVKTMWSLGFPLRWRTSPIRQFDRLHLGVLVYKKRSGDEVVFTLYLRERGSAGRNELRIGSDDNYLSVRNQAEEIGLALKLPVVDATVSPPKTIAVEDLGVSLRDKILRSADLKAAAAADVSLAQLSSLLPVPVSARSSVVAQDGKVMIDIPPPVGAKNA